MLAQSDVLVAGAHQPGPHGSRQMTNAKALDAYIAKKIEIDTMLTRLVAASANRLARDSTAVAIALGAIAACDYAITLVEV